jgi:drug/metabolite transporter (DMT)-like permease
LSAGQLLVGTVQLAVITPILTTTPARLPARVVLAIVALGALGTGIAYVLQYGLIRNVAATYLIPVVSTLAGVLLLGEHLTWNQPLGAAIIVAGAALSQRHSPSRPPPEHAAEPARQPAAAPLRSTAP